MAKARLQPVISFLRRVIQPGDVSCVSDAKLLERFVKHREEAAFELLVWRHERMVLGICQRVLGDWQDIEDAFQATFLILVRKARSIGKRESVASWLYKVAFRCALRVKARARKRTVLERHGVDLSTVQARLEPTADMVWSDLRPILDQEINSLPEKYRRSVVLCYLEGKTYGEAASELGCSLGTISTRLTRARELLRTGLARHGLALSSGVLAMALCAQAASAAVPAALVDSTLKTALLFAADKMVTGTVSDAAMLAQGVLKTMFLNKLKIAALFLLAVSLFAGVAATTYRALAANALGQPSAETKPEQDDSNKPPISSTVLKDETSPLIIDPDAGPIPAEALTRIGSTRFRQWGEVTGLAYSPDGKWLASISTSPADGTARVWDAATGKEKLRVQIKASQAGRFAPGQRPGAVGFSADSKQFLVVDLACIRGFDIATGKERFAHEIASKEQADQRPGAPRIINRLPGLIGAGLSPDGKTLVLAWRGPLQPGNVPGRIEVRDVATGKVRSTGEHPLGNYSFVPIEFSSDGTKFAVGAGPVGVGREEPVPIYDTASGKQIGQVRVEDKSIAQVRFLPNQETLAVLLSSGKYGYERAIGFYGLKNEKLVRTAKVDGTTYCFAVSPNGKLIFAGNGQKRFSQLIDAASGQEIARVPSSLSLGLLAFSPDGNLLAGARSYSGAISLYDIPARRYHRLTAEPVTFFGTRFSSDGTLLSQWGQHPIIDWRTGAVVRRLFGSDPENTQWPVSSPDGERLAVMDPKGPIRLVDTSTGKVVQTLSGPTPGGREYRVLHRWPPVGELLLGQGHPCLGPGCQSRACPV